MPRFSCPRAALLLAFAAIAAARADVTITVTPTLAPNAYGSPSWGAWQANSVFALENNLSSYGDPTQPTYYSAAPNTMSVSDNVVTNFPSWMGQANPTGNFAGEYGNRLTFGLVVDGNGSLISISELGFSATSSDPGNTLAFGYATGSYNYSAAYVGVIWGTNGNPNTYVTSGSNTQLVNEIVGRGSGNAWEALNNNPTYWPGPTEQDMIDQVGSAYGLPPAFSFTGVYTLDAATGSATVNFVSAPDGFSTAAGLALFSAALFLAGARRRAFRLS